MSFFCFPTEKERYKSHDNDINLLQISKMMSTTVKS